MCKADLIQERVLKRLLREIQLGSVQFSPDRVDGVSTDEPNTPDENRLHMMLSSWFGSAKEWPDLIPQLSAAANDPRYQDFFRWLPGGISLHRGLDMDSEALARMIGVSFDELDSLGGRWDKPFVVRPRGKGITSWSKNPVEAEKFADLGGASRRVIIHTVTSPENGRFIDAEEMTKRVSSWRPWRNEEEALALGPVRALSIEWW